ncbi:hypothetical protein GCM10010317_104140 [Streptomyces mirabilis]|nr:hypothetical protein GCM10010317_104140 [Streptomyces mirabilis]
MTRGFFVVQTGGRGAHHIRTIRARPGAGGLLFVVRRVVVVVLRPLGTNHVIKPRGYVALRSSSEC